MAPGIRDEERVICYLYGPGKDNYENSRVKYYQAIRLHVRVSWYQCEKSWFTLISHHCDNIMIHHLYLRACIFNYNQLNMYMEVEFKVLQYHSTGQRPTFLHVLWLKIIHNSPPPVVKCDFKRIILVVRWNRMQLPGNPGWQISAVVNPIREIPSLSP